MVQAPVWAEFNPLRMILPLLVSTLRRLPPLAFWTWKALEESTLKVLSPVKICPVLFNRATFDDNLASLSVPDETLLAFRLVKPLPSPVKLLLALLNVLAPVNVWSASSFAKFEPSLKSDELIGLPPISIPAKSGVLVVDIS